MNSKRDDSKTRPSRPTDPETPGAERPGAVIGLYTLIRPLGEGGFGSVFLAEQKEPVRRQVALKILKLGMDTRDIIARFEQERQALALMDHPNIAKVLDAGATDTGRPYFVMEYVDGVPITEYCDEKHLTVPERLELMWDVCQAVQHAHGKGIIHRDLKPSNVLVATQDGHPHPKVIDFGVAKATAAKLTQMTLQTEHFQMIGTPLYMSPEQAAGSLDIDTRTDVYSLGVLLYELLTGVTPVDKETLLSAAYQEMQRLVREVEPPKPSTRIASSIDTGASVAAQRQVEPKRLSSLLRGELDWIVMKALEKDRTRRYDTASALAMDIRRHLTGEPVLAAPPSASYVVTKFVKRHKGAVAAAAAVFVALLAGLGGTLWQARAASIQRDAARDAEREQRRLAGSEADARRLAEGSAREALDAKAVAEAREKEAERVAEFQSKLVRRVDPSVMGRDLALDLRRRIGSYRTERGDAEAERESALASFDELLRGVSLTDAARQIMDANVIAPGVAAAAEQFGEEPLTEARLRFALAETYQSIGLSNKAMPQAERAASLRAERLGALHRDTLRARRLLATIHFDLGQLTESEAILTELVGAADDGSSPEEDPDALRARISLAVLYMSRSRNEDAIRIFEAVLAIQERTLGAEHREVASTLYNLGTVRLNEQEQSVGVPLLERALRIRQKELGEDDVLTQSTRQLLAQAYQKLGRTQEANDAQQQAVATLERILGESHPGTLTAVGSLAKLYELQGRYAEAEPLYVKVLEKRRSILGDFHPETIKSMTSLAILYSTLGRHDEAGPLFLECVERCERTYGPDAPPTMDRVTNLAVYYWYQGRLEEAEPLFVRALEYYKKRNGVEDLNTAEAMMNLSILYERLGRADESSALLDTASATLTKLRGAEHPTTLRAKSSRAVHAFGRGDYAAAESLLVELLPAQRKVLGENDPLTLESEYNLALTYQRLERDAEAEPLFRRCLEGRREALGRAHPATLDTLQQLALFLAETDREAEARPLFEEEIAARRAAAAAEDASPATLDACASLLLQVPVEELRNAAEALRLATRANELTEKTNPAYLDTLARAQADTGNFAEAVATERRALELLPEKAPKRSEYEKRLSEYESPPK